MKTFNYDQFADEIVVLIGGVENIRGLEHCVKRFRFELVDTNIVDTEAVKKHEGVREVVTSGRQYHVIVGHEVIYAYNALARKYKFEWIGSSL